MVQANAIASMLKNSFSIPPIVTAIIVVIASWAVIIGGIKSISKVCERLIPFMAFFYVMGCLAIIVIRIETIPATISLIIESAFSNKAVVGGLLGAGIKEAIRHGIARGLFSNESGLGSAPIVAAAAQTKNPVRQAMVSASGTFWDTVVVCAITGTVIVNSGQWMGSFDGSELTSAAFADLALVGKIILSVGLLTFAFSTILGWSYYGEKAAEYLFGKRVIKPYRWLWVCGVLTGALLSLPVVWAFADIANALMVIPNVISILLLNHVIVKETKHYLWEDNLEEELE
jgi:AGCS family alanine or glycine:cation symporter